VAGVLSLGSLARTHVSAPDPSEVDAEAGAPV
jgi:hypothetical protein